MKLLKKYKHKALDVNGYKTDGILANIILTIMFAIPVLFVYYVLDYTKHLGFIIIYSWSIIFMLTTAVTHMKYNNPDKKAKI